MTDSDEPLDLLPLDALHRELGARMVPFAGYAMPIQYEGIIAEHQWTRSSAGLFDVSHMGQLLIVGEGLDEALEAILPADVKSLELGRMRYSMLLNQDGGILDDLMLTRWPGGIYMVVNGATKWDDIAHLHSSLPVGIAVQHMDQRALLALQGPKAFDALKRVTGGQWPLEALTFMRAGPFTIDGIEAHISRSGYTGEDGFEISVDSENVETVARTLLAQPEVKPIGLGARDSLRLEAGLPLYGHDLAPEITPVEAGLSFAIGQFLVSNFVGPELTDTLAALFSLAAVAVLLRFWQPRDGYSDGRATAVETIRDTPGRVGRAYATYGILVVTVLIGQSGNFAGMSQVRPPKNVTALLRCGQAGYALCPEPWVGPTAAAAPQSFRFPVWDFSWPGAYQLVDGRPAPIVQREPPVVAKTAPYALMYRLDFLAAAGTLVLIAT